jgi:ABC-type polysaccharide/polyol phosphate export permease
MANIFALLIVSDTRISGVWNRTILCGVRMSEIILASFIECLLIAFVLAVSMTSGLHIYDVEIAGSTFVVFVMMMEIAVVGFMLGFFISIIFDKFQASSGVGQLILVISVFTVGIFW